MVIKCNCFLYDKKLSDLGVDSGEEKVRFSFLSSEVVSIREVIEHSGDDTPADDKCCICFKSGDSIWIDLSYNEAIKQIFNINK